MLNGRNKMPTPSEHIHPEPAQQAPHTFGQQPVQVIEAYRESMVAVEQAEPSLASDPADVPGPRCDLVGQQASHASPAPDIDPELTIAWGEDPGWARHEIAPFPAGEPAAPSNRVAGTKKGVLDHE
jgi:hypothetical protein